MLRSSLNCPPVFWDSWGIHHLGATYASLSGTDQPVSMVMMHVWFVGLRGHFGEFAAKVPGDLFFSFQGFSVKS